MKGVCGAASTLLASNEAAAATVAKVDGAIALHDSYTMDKLDKEGGQEPHNDRQQAPKLISFENESSMHSKISTRELTTAFCTASGRTVNRSPSCIGALRRSRKAQAMDHA